MIDKLGFSRASNSQDERMSSAVWPHGFKTSIWSNSFIRILFKTIYYCFFFFLILCALKSAFSVIMARESQIWKLLHHWQYLQQLISRFSDSDPASAGTIIADYTLHGFLFVWIVSVWNLESTFPFLLHKQCWKLNDQLEKRRNE